MKADWVESRRRLWTSAFTLSKMGATGGFGVEEGCDLTFSEGHSSWWVENRL